MNQENQASLDTYANRNFKDTIFRKLFQEKEAILQLYNAVNDTHYLDADLLEIVTLENAIYMSMKNDLAFLVDFQLHMYEHQSTVNPNMPLRFLQYVSSVLYRSYLAKQHCLFCHLSRCRQSTMHRIASFLRLTD